MPAVLAHTPAGAVPDNTVLSVVATVVVAVAVVALVVEHHLVKHETPALAFAAGRRWVRRRRPGATAALAALVLATFPTTPASAQADAPVPFEGLPDLVSPPPIPFFEKVVEINGVDRRVVAFDGYIQNIGPGVLDLFGNPQEPDGVRQRIFEDGVWTEVATPPVRYETTDGHNHFHLMAAAEYELWNSTRTTKIGDASKVGFCLADTEGFGDVPDALYDVDDGDYCAQDQPDTESLRMGITPGWIDTYDANTTLQWVDITRTPPGRYWVGAITDPDDTIAEADETNNGLVFGDVSWTISGWEALPMTVEASGGRADVELAAMAWGTVGRPLFRIIEGPQHGQLNVPVGLDLHSSEVVWMGNEGFSGTDSFVVSVVDGDRDWPQAPVHTTITVIVDEAEAAVTPPPPEVGVDRTGDAPPPAEVAVGAAVTLTPELPALPQGGEWYAIDLPPGLRMDPIDGRITGVPVVTGSWQAQFIGRDNVSAVFVPMDITVGGEIDGLRDRNALSIPLNSQQRLFVGRQTPGGEYSATGLPEGMTIDPAVPLVVGQAGEVGTFDIVIEVRVDGEVVDSTELALTVRNDLRPGFPL